MLQSRGRPKVRAPNYTGIGDKNVLEKRAPTHPKYANVGAKLHTGNRWRDDLTFTRPKRKNEFFGRVKSELLARIQACTPPRTCPSRSGSFPCLSPLWLAPATSRLIHVDL